MEMEEHVPADLENRRVLVVDDNTDNRIILSEMLFEWKMHPVVCASAQEGLRMVTGQYYTFDVALVDICMPDMTGEQLALRIRDAIPSLPIIALSSADHYKGASVFSHKLVKPLHHVQLLTTLRRVMQKNTPASPTLKPYHDGKGDSRTKIENVSNNTLSDSKQSILIAEDVPYNRALLRSMLMSIGYSSEQIYSVPNGQEACAMIETVPVDIILLDLSMPDMSGYDVIRYIQSSGYWETCTVIVVTASAMNSDRHACREMDVRYFLSKPVDIQQLQDVMVKCRHG